MFQKGKGILFHFTASKVSDLGRKVAEKNKTTVKKAVFL
ncbi:hypothetical protein ADIS_4123 [Lunatimonas lonarensis]|uniref:Uncharacterized protein n=1 Tax=Lunatimonas lonarensis TaxID=1232681 RepID=R7ZN19_9BACT|nr:hypothetical protein ADIS_4123 [Lunatimonas lonarensis]